MQANTMLTFLCHDSLFSPLLTYLMNAIRKKLNDKRIGCVYLLHLAKKSDLRMSTINPSENETFYTSNLVVINTDSNERL